MGTTEPSKDVVNIGPGFAAMAILAILAGALAGVGSWAAGEQVHKRYKASPEAAKQRYDFRQLNIEQAAADAKNAALAFGFLGAALGLGLGLAGGLASRSI